MKSVDWRWHERNLGDELKDTIASVTAEALITKEKEKEVGKGNKNELAARTLSPPTEMNAAASILSRRAERSPH